MRKIGILTSGGDAPGMNAAIRAIVRAGSTAGFEMIGIYDGYKGILEKRFVKLSRSSVSDLIIRGGTLLGSARLPEFKDPAVVKKAATILKKEGIDALVVIGGDGTYKGALALKNEGIATMALPGTIDNDISCTDYTIGYDTALTTVVENIDKLRDTSSSHHRCSVVEVMGNRCGDLALYSGITTGAEIVITSETGFDEEKVLESIRYYEQVKKKNHCLVIISEKITDVEKLAEVISQKTGFSGRATVLGHIQRGGSPTPFDRLLATRLGDYAITRIKEGYSGECMCMVKGKVVAIEIDKALKMNKKKRKDDYELHHRLV